MSVKPGRSSLTPKIPITHEPASEELTQVQICDILEKCKATGVSELTLGGFHVKFGQGQSSPAAQYSHPEQPFDPRPSKKTILDQEAEVKAEMLANLQQEDPELYERLIESGELIDEQGILGLDAEVPGSGGI